MSDGPAQSETDREIAQRKRAQKRARLAQLGALAAVTVAAMTAMNPRSWWLLAALGAFGYWARGRVYAQRAHVGEVLGQRAWAIIAQLRGDYSESELDVLRMLDARVVVAIESGDLASVEPLLDEVEAIVTESDACLTVHDLRAFVLAARGRKEAAKESLARGRGGRGRPWTWLTERMLERADARGETEEPGSSVIDWDATPAMRALIELLQREPGTRAMYRSAARVTTGRVAYESWMNRVVPTLSHGLVAWGAMSSAMDASWNRPSTAQPVTAPKRPVRDRLRSPWALTILSLAALQALALFKGIELVRAPTRGLVLLFLVPIVGLAAAAAWSWAERKSATTMRWSRSRDALMGAKPARYMTNWMASAIERDLQWAKSHWVAGTSERAITASREAFATVWALGSPRDRALVLREHAVNLAWAGLHEESEAVLARMDEDYATYSHTVTARFEARLVSAVVREDRARAERIAREYVDTLAVSAEIEVLWKRVYAALVDRALRDEARSAHRAQSHRVTAVRWLTELLSDERVRVEPGTVRANSTTDSAAENPGEKATTAAR
jgi:hypothetical protein